MADDPVTLGELGRRLDKFETRFETAVSGISRQITELQFVNRDVYDSEMTALRAEVQELKDAKTRFVQLLAGSLIMPILVALILAVVLTQ